MRRFTKKPSVQASTRAIKAATANDMIDAFEERIAELSVQTSTSISCSTDSLSVEINDSDYEYRYEDVEGGFGDPGKIYTLAEIKDYWNRENQNDPVLQEYSDYQTWWNDTLNNFLKEVD